MTSGSRHAGRALAVLVATVAVVPLTADESTRVQKMEFSEAGGLLRVTTAVNVLDESDYLQLDEGLPSTVMIRVSMSPTGKQRVVAAAVIRRQIVYDLWDEVYTIVSVGPSGRRTVQVRRKPEALTALTGVDVALTSVDALDPGTRYTVTVEGVLNPVSAANLAEVRRWLSEGSGGGLDRGGSFFGSFVSVFVNPKLPAAERVLRLTSQPYIRRTRR